MAAVRGNPPRAFADDSLLLRVRARRAPECVAVLSHWVERG
jgi:hypothetical protein